MENRIDLHNAVKEITKAVSKAKSIIVTFFKTHKIFNPFENYLLYLFFAVILPISVGLRKNTYHLNDDVVIRVLLEGSMFSPRDPSEYVLFINVFYARFIKFLYLNFPLLPWYDILLVFPIFIGSIILSKIIYSVADKNIKVILSFFLILFSYTVIHSLTFTIIAGACSVYGLIISISVLLNKDDISLPLSFIFYLSSFIFHLSSFIFLVLSSLIRFDEMILCVFFGSVFTLVCFWKDVSLKKLSVFYLIVFLSIGTAFSLNYLHIKEYSKITDPFNPLEYNAIKSEFTDKHIAYEKMGRLSRSNETELNQALKENNISKNDFYLLSNWGFSGKDFFNIDNMKKFKKCCSKQIQGSFFQKLKKITFYKESFKIHCKSIFFIIIIIFLYNKNYKIFIKNIFIISFVILFSISVVPFIPKPLPMRVMLPIYFLIIYFIGISAFKNNTSLIISMLICIFIYLPFYGSPENKRAKIDFRPSSPSVVYYAIDFPIFMAPFEKSPDYIKNLYFWGWPVSTPAFQKRFKEDIYTMLLKDEASLLVYGKNISASKPFEVFIKEHFGKDCYTTMKKTHIPNIYHGKFVCNSSKRDVFLINQTKCFVDDAYCAEDFI